MASRDADARPPVRRRPRDRARLRQLPGAAGRPRARGGLHLAAQLAAPGVDRAGAARPASTCCARSRSAADPAESRAAFDVAEREGRLLMEAFMYRHHPQTATAGRAGRRRRDRQPAADPRRRSASRSRTPPTSACRPGLDGGALMDVGCYCVSAARLLAGEPESVTGEQVLGGDGVDVRVRRARCASTTTCSRTSTPGSSSPAALGARGRGQSTGGCCSTIPGTA